MKISKKCLLVLSNLYEYDFRSCAYNLMDSIGWKLGDIVYTEKDLRNVQIGLIQRENKNLRDFLLYSMETLIKYYIENNFIDNDDVIIKQRDGFVLDKYIKLTESTMKLDMRGIISKLIISPDRRRYLAIYSNGKIKMKGVSNKPINTDFLEMFKDLNFSTKKGILNGLELIRKNIMNSKTVEWFGRKNGDKIIIPILGGEEITINSSVLRMVDSDEIDKMTLWDNIIWPFAKSLLIHCHSFKI